jgi:L-malate glycosyltransferase
MRVMIIASGDLWAGAEVMIFQLVSGLKEYAVVELRVVLLNPARLADELEKLGVTVHVVDEAQYSFLTIVHKIRQLVRNFAPDILHSHRYKENILAWMGAYGLKRCRLVATQHGMPERISKRQTIKGRLRAAFFFRLLARWFDCTVFVSAEMRQALVACHGFSDDSTAVIHNGMALPQDVGRHSGHRMVVGSAGRLFPIKDYGLLVDIARAVIRQSDQVDFVLAGEGPERAMLEGKMKQYCLPEKRFKLLGHQEDMQVFYQGIDVYINTSLHEGIPMSVLEAMAYGAVVVAPDVGGFPEIIEDRVSGFLVEGREPQSFVRCILDLLDPAQRDKMGSASRSRIAACFSREAMARQYYQLYERLLTL